jgi:nicotinate-nucleotide--dimethylbenzimidazole phosphoribosyltransferase
LPSAICHGIHAVGHKLEKRLGMADWIDGGCPVPSETHAKLARQRQANLTKPAGSLGHLERLAIDLAALQATDRPRALRVPIIIFAGDHGVAARGVSAYPSDVTVQMLYNFASGGAAISVLARELGVPLLVVDAGTLSEQPVPGVLTDKPRRGTRDFGEQAALTAPEVVQALGCGRRALRQVIAEGADLVILGEMGIGNTTSAAAIACALTGRRPELVVGNGTGLDDAGRERKLTVIKQALAFHRIEGSGSKVEDVLSAVGGLEIAALTGAIVASAQNGVPVLIDGFIVSVAALAAVRINPSCRPWLIFSHRSAERGHQLMLEELDARPILDLGLRLGEGSGAALALPVLRLACALHNGMATFDEAAVSGRIA